MNWWQGHGQKWRACPTCQGNVWIKTVHKLSVDLTECVSCTNGVVCRLCSKPVKHVTVAVSGEIQNATLECGGCQWRQAI